MGQILKNDLRRAALKRKAVELNEATAEKREAILVEIEWDVGDQVRRRARSLVTGM